MGAQKRALEKQKQGLREVRTCKFSKHDVTGEMKLSGRARSHIESDPNNTRVAHLSSSSSRIRQGKLRRKVWNF